MHFELPLHMKGRCYRNKPALELAEMYKAAPVMLRWTDMHISIQHYDSHVHVFYAENSVEIINDVFDWL